MSRRTHAIAWLALALLAALGCGKKDPPSGPSLTCPDPAPPATPTGLTPTPGNGSITLSWQNPADADFAGVLLLRRVGTPPTSHHDPAATLVYGGNLQSVRDSGLANGSVYHYAIWSFDTCDPPNYSTAPMLTFATPGLPAPPPPATNASVTPGVHRLTVRWTNPVAPNFSGVIVRRGLTGGAVVYSGSGTEFVDTYAGLMPGSTYCYSIVTRDTYGQFSTTAATACGVPEYEYRTFDIPSLTMGAQWPDARCGGDTLCDFAGQGPAVTLRAEIRRTGINYFVQVVEFEAVQPGGGVCKEKSSGATWVTNSWPMPDGWTFDRYVGPTGETVTYTDDDLDEDVLTGTSVIDALRIMGETPGGDVCGSAPDAGETHVVSMTTRVLRVQLRR